MRLTPRAEEIAPVVAILESDAYATSEAMAKDLIKTVAKGLLMRDTFFVAFAAADQPPRTFFGPYYSDADALKVIAQGAVFSRGAVVKLTSSGMYEAFLAGADWPGFCLCTHPKTEHHFEARSRGRCGHSLTGACSCTKFVEQAVKRVPKTRKAAA